MYPCTHTVYPQPSLNRNSHSTPHSTPWSTAKLLLFSISFHYPSSLSVSVSNALTGIYCPLSLLHKNISPAPAACQLVISNEVHCIQPSRHAKGQDDWEKYLVKLPATNNSSYCNYSNWCKALEVHIQFIESTHSVKAHRSICWPGQTKRERCEEPVKRGSQMYCFSQIHRNWHILSVEHHSGRGWWLNSMNQSQSEQFTVLHQISKQ